MIKIHPNLINFVKPDDHSKFSPSSAERWWGGCSYSIQASEGIEEEESPHAAEGTLAHSVCEAVYRQEMLGMTFPLDLSMQMVSLPDRGDEMMEAAQGFFEVCDYWTNNKDLVGDVLWFGQERGIPIFPEKSCYGTGDFIIVGTKASVVIDFKYGRKPVKAESLQLRAYAAGLARHIDEAPPEYKIYSVIYQPRVSHEVKETFYTISQLYNDLKDIWFYVNEAERTDLEPIEGNHCFWCPARRVNDDSKKCKLIIEKPLKIAQENFDKFLADSNLYPDSAVNKANRDEAIIKLMTLKPAIDAIVEQAHSDFMVRFNNGEVIPGLTIETVLGNRKYSAENDNEAAKSIKKLFPHINPLKVETKTKIKTITELEKELGKGALDSVCQRKVSRQIAVLDEKSNEILNSMKQYSINISKS